MILIGWVVWLLFSVALVFFPTLVFLVAIKLGGRINGAESFFMLTLFLAGIYSAYRCLQSVSFEIVIN